MSRIDKLRKAARLGNPALLRTLCAWAMVLIVALGNCLADPLEQAREEYQVKAAFLYNFAKFVTWPDDTLAPGNSIVICVDGKTHFGHWLEDTVRGKTIEGHNLEVRRVSTVAEAGSCHILFVGAGDERGWLSRLAALGRAGILTVGESDAAAAAGAIVNFTLEGDKVRFEINTSMADRERLRISSRLLSLARVVRR
jgi:hypothetical protein